ncbi:MAG: winged helix-turn-helix domain-containing protein [Terriglobales bacterium]|jgi:DNA-binding winged helix-turn-helix (wHTH) protein/TolB-like protein
MNASSVLPRRVYRFGLFQVDPDSGKLLRQGVPVKLQEQPLRVLCLLLEHSGQVVTREELRQSLWPDGTYVEFDGSLNAALKRLRFALGDDADNPIFIQTVPRHGYRFIAPVECEQSSDISTSVEPLPLESSGLQISGDRRSPGSRLRLQPWWILAAMAVVLGFMLAGWRYFRRSQPTRQATRRVIAVLPFTNEGAGPDFDYLRYAIPNDLVTDLTYARSVTVRPFASTSRYASQPADPAAVGKELRVTHVVAGGFLLDNHNLRVTLELVDVAQNRPVWREEVTVSPQDMVALHDKLAVRAAQGMLPAIDVANASTNETPTPKNEKALELFSHSLTIPRDPGPNQLAIKMLEESVSVDSGYAPAWGELGARYSNDYHYGNGGEAAVAKALQAFKRQSELDPNWPVVSTYIRVEQGDLDGAYDQAAGFLRRHPDVATGHHAMSYVLRYAGLLDESERQCGETIALDPGFNGFRSCATPFIFQGDYASAQTYIRLDEHSGFAAMLRILIALRTGNAADALAESDAASQGGFRFADLARMYLNHAPEAELRRAAKDLEVEPRSSRDPETLYVNAAVLSFCGQGDAALRQLRKAIKGKYCSYPAMEKDPLFDPIRQRAEFAELRQAAIQCQQDFLAHRQHVNAALQASHF